MRKGYKDAIKSEKGASIRDAFESERKSSCGEYKKVSVQEKRIFPLAIVVSSVKNDTGTIFRGGFALNHPRCFYIKH